MLQRVKTMKDESKPKVLIYRSRMLNISETFIADQIRQLVKWKGLLTGVERVKDGLELCDIEIRLLPQSINPFLGKILRHINPMFEHHSKRAVDILQRENARLMHVHFGVEAVNVWPLAKVLNLPLLVTLHGYDINTYREWWEAGRGGRLMKSYPMQLLELAQEKSVHFLAVSNAIKQRAIEYGIPEKKISISYIGVDTQKFKPGPIPISERRQILYVGRLIEKKGYQYLLNAFSGIQDKFPETELVIVGSGPLEAAAKQLARERGIRVRFLGALSSAKVREQLDITRIFCLPSVTAENGDAEGLPIVILEAQASGIPVVTSARGGAEEGMIHEKTGFKHKMGDIGEMQCYLTKLLQDNDLADSFGKEARLFTEVKMDIKDHTKTLEILYSRYSTD